MYVRYDQKTSVDHHTDVFKSIYHALIAIQYSILRSYSIVVIIRDISRIESNRIAYIARVTGCRTRRVVPSTQMHFFIYEYIQ